MKTIVIIVSDDTKFNLLVSFLREIQFINIDNEISPVSESKKMSKLPQSVLHPVKAKNFRMFSRDELHDRQSFF